ncbi:MAG: citrate synthase, partial [Clostridia bacterium]|nr:citrate synthase [Clostridia bacterium]
MDFNEINLIVKYSHALSKMAAEIEKTDKIEPELYDMYEVKRGLRDKNGKGVLCGLTEISEVTSWEMIDGVRTPIPGIFCYRGYNVKDLIANCQAENRFGFEETVYL